MKIYAATYSDCIYESAYGTISLHKTREGAIKAIEAHKRKIKEEWLYMHKEELEAGEKPMFDWDVHQGWDIDELVLEV